jgi:hypothetical protein
MTNSMRIARIVGPALIATGVTEWMNIEIFASNAAPVVYLDGTLLFVAGLAIVQAHNRWVKDWSTLVTLIGWILFLGGLYRMFAPEASQVSRGVASDAAFAALIAVGGSLTYKAYIRPD